MAQAPFQTAGNVADIAPVALRGGFAPAKGIVDAVADVADVALPVIRDNLEKSITDEVTGKTKSIRLALQATRFPSIQESVFSEEALANPVVASALAEFTQIQDAVKQGRLPGTFALERLEVIQNNAIKNSPDFEQEIRGAMRDATGQDPSKTLFSQLLSGSKASQTPEQKAQDQLIVEATKNGVTVDQQVAFNNSVMNATIDNNRFDLARKQGLYTASMMGSDVRNRSALIMVDVLEGARQHRVAGGQFTPEVISQLKNRVSASIAAATSSLIAQTRGLPIDGATIQTQMAPLVQMQENLDKMLEDGSMELLVGSNNKVTTSLIQQGVLNMPELQAAWALGGPRGFAELLKFIEKSGSSAIGKALTANLSSSAASAFLLQDVGASVLTQYNLIGSPVLLETTADKNARILAGAVVIGTKGADEEFQIAALNDMRKYGEEMTWSAFESNKILTATAASNKLKAAFINMQVSTTAGLTTELLTLAADPAVDLERLVLVGDALTVTQRSIVERTALSQTGVTADAALNTYATRFNRANNISAKYSGAGILPPSRYQGSVSYWDVVKGEAANAVVTPEQTTNKVVKWGRNESGAPIRLDGGE